MTIKKIYYRKVATRTMLKMLGSSYAIKLVKKIIANYLHAFSQYCQQFMKSAVICLIYMFGKILVFCY